MTTKNIGFLIFHEHPSFRLYHRNLRGRGRQGGDASPAGGEPSVTEVEIGLPDGERVRFPVVWSRTGAGNAQAAVRKDAGDDPDITHQAVVKARVAWKEGEGN